MIAAILFDLGKGDQAKLFALGRRLKVTGEIGTKFKSSKYAHRSHKPHIQVVKDNSRVWGVQLLAKVKLCVVTLICVL